MSRVVERAILLLDDVERRSGDIGLRASVGRERRRRGREAMRSWGLTAMAIAGLLGGLVAAGNAEGAWPTPEIEQIVDLGDGNGLAYAMRGELGVSGEYVGLAVICARRGAQEIEAVALFGGFPADRRPVQLAVRSADGRIERFGPVVSGGPESGFHSPRMVDPGEARRFVDVALRSGALVSNGYRSFWNRASESRNREVREAFIACLARRGE